MKTSEMLSIANEMIATANLSDDLSIRVASHGNSISLQAVSRGLFSRNYTVTKDGVTRTVNDTHYEYSQRGYGMRVWGIQGEQRIREKIAAYIEEVVR